MYRKGSDSMYYSLMVIMLAVLTVFLLLVYRKLDKSRADGCTIGYTVIPLAGSAGRESIERLVRSCFWENEFGGGMKRDIILVSCGCGELDEWANRLSSELKGVRVVSAAELLYMMTGGFADIDKDG